MCVRAHSTLASWARCVISHSNCSRFYESSDHCTAAERLRSDIRYWMLHFPAHANLQILPRMVCCVRRM